MSRLRRWASTIRRALRSEQQIQADLKLETAIRLALQGEAPEEPPGWLVRIEAGARYTPRGSPDEEC